MIIIEPESITDGWLDIYHVYVASSSPNTMGKICTLHKHVHSKYNTNEKCESFQDVCSPDIEFTSSSLIVDIFRNFDM